MLAIDWLVLKVQLQKMLRFDSSIIKALWLVHCSLRVVSHAWLPGSRFAEIFLTPSALWQFRIENPRPF